MQRKQQKSGNNNRNQRRNSTGSQSSSSDDGGFLSRRSFINSRASWRRPLVASPSQLSLQSNGSARGFLNGLGGLLRVGAGRYQNVPRNQQYVNIYRNIPQPASRPLHQKLHINTLAVPQTPVAPPNLYTPSRVSRIFSSSPASTIGIHSPWSPAANQFSDLSTVYPSSAERSFPTPSSAGLGANANNAAIGGNTAAGSRYNRYYSHELPSLRTIQEETRRMNQGFVPLHIPPSPSWRGYYQSQTPYHSYRPRTRWYPRHSRVTRSHSELLSPLPHLNFAAHYRPSGAMGLEASPESRSSSSGFGSKNTSNQQHGSHHSGSTSEWRLLPPYRPPPPPPSTSYYYQDPGPHYHHHHSLHHHHHHHPSATAAAAASATVGTQSLPYYNYNTHTPGSLKRPTTPPYTMGNWLDMISRLNAATDTVNVHKAVDVGSVDGHYEFDPSTPTPSASTPTGGPRDDLNLLNIDTGTAVGGIFHTATSGIPPTAAMTLGPMRKQRYGASARYDNIESRVQAMKDEFYAYRKRQAMKRAGVVELESMC